jgi:thiol-disulfide isomerase/thioredoxin
MLSRIREHLPKLLLELTILLLLVLAVEAFLTRNAASGVAPDIVATTIQGEAFTLQGMRGQPAIIHFWASWCPICELEQGTIDSLASDYPFISVAMQSGSAAEVVAYLREQGVSYPVVNDPEGSLAKRYGVSGVPATFILDADGTVRFVTRGYTSSVGLRLRLWLASLV